jgi:hypothetical protein
MLKPAGDRLDYSEMLMPPYGYETTFVVGTTYSLDLDALIGVCLALGLSESIDNELKDNPIYLLEGIDPEPAYVRYGVGKVKFSYLIQCFHPSLA